MLNGDIDDSLSEKDFLISVWDQALVEGMKAYDFINSEEYELDKEQKQKALVNVENWLLWDGMPTLMRKKREKCRPPGIWRQTDRILPASHSRQHH